MKKLNVLVVEDEEEWIRVYKSAFERFEAQNLRFFYVSSLVDALMLMEERLFEIFIINLKIIEKTKSGITQYFEKVNNLISEVDKIIPFFNRERFLYSYCLIREIVNTLPYFKIMVVSAFVADTSDQELLRISSGHILRSDIKQKDKDILSKEIKSIRNNFNKTFSSLIRCVPAILPNITDVDQYLIKHSLKDFNCKQFSIYQLYKGRHKTRLFHIKEQHEDIIETPEYLVKISDNEIIDREWNNCDKMLGIGKVYPDQIFAPSKRENLIRIMNCSCIIYPYEIGFKSFKDFFQQIRNIPRDEQDNLLIHSTQGILKKLQMLQRQGASGTRIKKPQTIKEVLKINIKVIEETINNFIDTPLKNNEIDTLKEIYNFYNRIQNKIINSSLSPVHGDFHCENILLKKKR